MGRGSGVNREATSESSGIEETLSRSDLRAAEQLARGMEEISGKEVDPVVAAAIPESDPERALLWLQGDISLLPSSDEACPGMTSAAGDLLRAIENGQRVAIFADYDVDGITGGEVLRGVLERLGQDPVQGWASPTDGFGLTEDFVRRAHAEGCEVLVTVDCGSTSLEAIALAKELGMSVVVTDHHKIRDPEQNKADHHLNPGLHEPRPSTATGSQMAWYLGAEMLRLHEGEVPDEFYREPLFLAGMGCASDWGPHRDSHNRPFFKAGSAPEGVRGLAEMKNEDASTMNRLWGTSAALNLPKRTAFVSGEDSARMLRASGQEEIEAAAAVLFEGQKKQAGLKKSLTKAAGEADAPKGRIASHVSDIEGVAGEAGPVANEMARRHETPAFVFALLKEEDGEEIYKFSGRTAPGHSQPIGSMSEDPEIREIILTGGGHAKVFSGEVRKQDIPRLLGAMEDWAARQEDFYATAEGSAESYGGIAVHQRLVSPERVPAIVSGAKELAPFHRVDGHTEPRVSVRGEIGDVRKEGRVTRATLSLPGGITQEVQLGRDISEGSGEVCLCVRADGPPMVEAVL